MISKKSFDLLLAGIRHKAEEEIVIDVKIVQDFFFFRQFVVVVIDGAHDVVVTVVAVVQVHDRFGDNVT